MSLLKDVVLLCSDSCRTRAYLSQMQKASLLPSEIIFVDIPSITNKRERTNFSSQLFNNQINIKASDTFSGVPIHKVSVNSINESVVISMLKKLPQKFVIFSLPGLILGKLFFSIDKQYIHVHPGRLPDYRGSTPFYYSMLAEKKIEATAIFLEQNIDTGAIIKSKQYPIPSDTMTIDVEYDPWLRADLLVDILREYHMTQTIKTKPQQAEQGDTYYIIHPVLKCLALNIE